MVGSDARATDPTITTLSLAMHVAKVVPFDAPSRGDSYAAGLPFVQRRA